jgi:hypothetical protein
METAAIWEMPVHIGREVMRGGAFIGLAGIVALILGFTHFVMAAEDHQAAISEATSIAGNWLTLVDDGKYDSSWDAASPLLQNHVTKESFARMVAAVRQPLGKVVSRKLNSAQYSTSLPGAPDGEYVVLKYDTSFENKKSARETITPMLDKGGKWRVSGYYIK